MRNTSGLRVAACKGLALALGVWLVQPVAASATPIGALDLASNSSVFEIGTVALLPTLGWSNFSGSARVFDAGNGGIIGTTPYGNYQVQFNTGVAIQPHSAYTLMFDMGFIADFNPGTATYSFSLGTLNGSTFTALNTKTGSVTWAGNMNNGTYSANDVSLAFDTGGLVSGDSLAVRWAQTGTTGPSDFFGFDNVLLDGVSTPVPEPATLSLLGSGIAAMYLRGRRRRQACGSSSSITAIGITTTTSGTTSSSKRKKSTKRRRG